MVVIEKGFGKKYLGLLLRFRPAKFDGDIFIAAGSAIKNFKTIINKGTRINGPITVKGHGIFTLGKYCALGDHIDVITSNHEMNGVNLQNDLQKKITGKADASAKRDVTIGNNVWIGNRVILLPGVKVGDGAVIGAGSVVNKDVAPYAIVAGSPARQIRMRFNDQVISSLSEIKWWDWSLEKMKRNKEFFQAKIESQQDDWFRKYKD